MSTETEDSSKSPGEMLREARKSLGLSMADVAAMTRIPKAMLKHLESDRFEEYSAEVFVRGHLRNYAREVELEPEAVLQAFDRRMGTIGENVEVDEESSPEEESEPEEAESLGVEKDDLFDLDVEAIREHVRPAHLVAVTLVVVALFVVFGVLTQQRATAQKNTDFRESSGSASESWESEEKSRETRWRLQRSAEGAESKGAD